MNEHQDRDERGVNRMLRRLFLAALVGGAAGCASGDATEHPQIRHAVKPAVLLDTTAAASPAAAASAQALLAFRSRVASARVATTIGSADGPSYAVFGRIADVALDGGGRIYVLDGFADEIRQFEPDGEFRRSFGGRGDGPTEFRDPIGMAFTSSGTLAVAMRASIKLFDVADSAVALVAMHRAGDIPPPRAMCVLGDHLVVRGWTDEDQRIVQMIAPDGSRTRSFGTGYERGGSLVRSQLSRGPIACTNDPPRVVVGYNELPLLQAYDTTGVLQWEVSLPDFTPPRVIESVTDGGAPAVSTDVSRPADRLLSLKSMPGGIVVAYVGRLGPADANRFQPIERIQGFAFSAEDGTGVRLPDRRLLLMAAAPELLVGVDADPTEGYERIVVLTTDPGSQ